MNDGKWLTVAQAAAALGCSDRTVRRRVADGELPHKKVRGRLWLKVADSEVTDQATPGTGGNVAELAALRARVDQLQSENRQLWATLQESQRLLAAPTPAQPFGWWDKILGRG